MHRTNLEPILFLFVLFIKCGNFFNLSPAPNIILHPPKLQTFLPKTESSLFGFSLDLLEDSVIIGAPKAQSSLATQRRVNQTGAIFKCRLNTGECENFIVDKYGNLNIENSRDEYKSDKKDNQLLGWNVAAIGYDSNTAKMIACAPKIKTNLHDTHYLLHGSCYVTDNIDTAFGASVSRISPLRGVQSQIGKSLSNINVYNHMYGEAGFSLHVPDNSEEVLIGAPGIYNWKGSVIRQKLNNSPAEVANPGYVNLEDDSYFGYSISSAYFLGPGTNRLLYIASAPQAEKQSGRVYIFDIVQHLVGAQQADTTIKFHKTFKSTQFGEYFGYSVLTEDFNNDDLPDVAISAPMYSRNRYFEHGTVYIFLNKGKLDFEEPTLLQSEYEFNGRFGTAMSKIGDLNLDGYNDLAVGAPFEENGAVYIFYGGSFGLSTRPAQKLVPPSSQSTALVPGTHRMFGHAISRGIDIDKNKYTDIAVGAPNDEAVYVFKSYPIVQISATISPSRKELNKDDTRFQITACWRYFSSAQINQTTGFKVTLKVDPNHGRASFANNNKVMSENLTINDQVNCHEYDVAVKFNLADIFKPLDIEMEYDLIEKIPADGTFCNNCLALDHESMKSVRSRVIYSTGCRNTICKANLNVKSSLTGKSTSYILGSTRTMAVKYEVTNFGETAYLAQIRVSLSNMTSFAKIPSNCQIEDDDLLCNLDRGNPLFNNQTSMLIVNIDTSRLTGRELNIKASVSSAGDELDDTDNHIIDLIHLTQLSEVDVIGHSSVMHENINDQTAETLALTHELQIINNGPSTVDELILILQLPIALRNSPNHIIPIESVAVTATYKNSLLKISQLHNNLFSDGDEAGDDNDNDDDEDEYEERNKFTTEPVIAVDFAPKVLGQPELTRVNRTSRKRRELSDVLQENTSAMTYDYLDKLPSNKTIFFDCKNDNVDNFECASYSLTLKNFQRSNDPIQISLSFSINMKEIDKVLDEEKNIFVLQTNLELQNPLDEDGVSMKIRQQLPFTVFYKQLSQKVAYWIYLAAGIAGLLLLLILSLILYKVGFFRREKREELERLTKEGDQTYSKNIDDEDKYF